MASTLELVLIFLASAVLVVVVFRMLHLPPLLGYLLAGIAIGPHALGWIPESEEPHLSLAAFTATPNLFEPASRVTPG